MKRSDLQIILAVVLVILASFLRVMNASWHFYNFAPVAAIGLFGGAVLARNKIMALLVPVAGMLLADVFFQLFTSTPGFYAGQWVNYSALVAATVLGFAMQQPKLRTTIPFIFGASTVFFIVSNFGYFMAGYNGYSFAGLQKTYIDAIPFYRNSLVGDLVGGIALFCAWFAAEKSMSLRASRVRA
ncbi:MAG: hypothetical protein EBZ77_10805 [Chitinophagia bacterium]|nr:hypothetical protein [Chitinophagia bacterium]